MKLSVSLPEDDVAFLDSYAQAHEAGSRSAALQEAIGLLRSSELAGDYERAWAEWDAGGEPDAWEVTSADGLEA